MKARPLLCLALFAQGLFAADPGPQEPLGDLFEVRSALPASPAPPQRPVPATPPLPRIMLTAPMVTLNGVARSDLAQVLADALADRLLRQGGCVVLDSLFAVPGARSDEAPEAAGDSDALTDLPDFVLASSVVAEGSDYHVTLRKIRPGTGEVAGLARASQRGGLAAIDKAAGQALARLMPPPDVRPQITSIKAWMTPPPPPKPKPAPVPSEIAAAPRAISPHDVGLLAKMEAVAQAKRDAFRFAALSSDPKRVGSIAAVDARWSFAVVSCGRSHGLQPGDRLMTWNGRDPANVVEFTVTRTEGSRVVVDVPDTAAARLQSGDAVFTWSAPAE